MVSIGSSPQEPPALTKYSAVYVSRFFPSILEVKFMVMDSLFCSSCTDMTTAGGGWTLVGIISSGGGISAMSCDLNWNYDNQHWTSKTTVLNADSFDAAKDHK